MSKSAAVDQTPRKLTPDQVREARRVYRTLRDTPSLRQLARDYGVSELTLRKAAMGKSYRSVTD